MLIKQSIAVVCPSQFHLFFLTSFKIIYSSNYFQRNNIIIITNKNTQISRLIVRAMLLNDLHLESITKKKRTRLESFILTDISHFQIIKLGNTAVKNIHQD
jgi:hypothetical protein